jgi:tetratricopeptide (TPR) repeat protein
MPLYYLLYLWLLISSKVEVTKIARANRMIFEAEASFHSGQHLVALVKYRYLIHSLQLRNTYITLNLAHCYYLTNEKEQALKYYQQLTHSANTSISSIAYQQLGVITFEKQQYKASLEYFRKSLAIDPGNDASRYNYELAARLIPAVDSTQADQKERNKHDSEAAPPPPDPDDTTRQSGNESNQGENHKDSQTEQQQEIQRKLRKINLSEEKANMILDAMKNNKIQYIQQTKKRSPGQQAKNLPDW